MAANDAGGDLPVIRDHRRQWRDCLYVYPVISRRARGVSVGVNLNPDKTCNFSCLYCQINRSLQRSPYRLDVAVLTGELRSAMRAVIGGEIWGEDRFAATPEEMRRLNDIAFSGDGEPTCLANFDEAVAAAAAVKREFCRDDVKIVVITNASMLDSPQVARALPILDAANGQIWAKLDAGTEEGFRRVNRPRAGLTLARIVDNIGSVARRRAVVIQSLFFRIDGSGPSADEIAAYCYRLKQIVRAGGGIELVQVHTIARPPRDPAASMLPDAQLDEIAEHIRAAVAGVPVETYYGQDVPPQGS
jgi:wyosine [tRNA(Phe)-imidazoG37] synthetase (radical SAM superfamily)